MILIASEAAHVFFMLGQLLNWPNSFTWWVTQILNIKMSRTLVTMASFNFGSFAARFATERIWTPHIPSHFHLAAMTSFFKTGLIPQVNRVTLALVADSINDKRSSKRPAGSLSFQFSGIIVLFGGCTSLRLQICGIQNREMTHQLIWIETPLLLSLGDS